MATTAAKEKIPETFNFTWCNIPITLNYVKDYWASVGVGHLEVKAEEPLPITETGYRSIWVLPGQLDRTDPISYVRESLDELSRSKKWKAYLEDKKQQELAKSQLSLF
ncbi:hypothetical protein [Flagellimonas sp.]|uniref:hypothetical protein n=1 Tax=Flagellimonas sp. TaxID=2058762 RepID=UPI003BAB39D5